MKLQNIFQLSAVAMTLNFTQIMGQADLIQPRPLTELLEDPNSNINITDYVFFAPEKIGTESDDIDITLEDIKGKDIGEAIYTDEGVAYILWSAPVTTLSKRQEGCVDTSYQTIQLQAVSSYTYWNHWVAATNCNYCGSNGGAACSKTMGWSVSNTIGYSAGFDVGLTSSLKKIIDGSASINFGKTWSTTNTNSGSTTCTAPSNGKTQVWSSPMFGALTSQVQTCTYYVNSCTPVYDKVCGAWSAWQHSYWPIKNNVQDGCSAGNDARCNLQIGQHCNDETKGASVCDPTW